MLVGTHMKYSPQKRRVSILGTEDETHQTRINQRNEARNPFAFLLLLNTYLAAANPAHTVTHTDESMSLIQKTY